MEEGKAREVDSRVVFSLPFPEVHGVKGGREGRLAAKSPLGRRGGSWLAEEGDVKQTSHSEFRWGDMDLLWQNSAKCY